MSSSDYIVVTSSRNLDDGSSDNDPKIHEESDAESLSALAGQGISILDEEKSLPLHAPAKNPPASNLNIEPRDQVSRELMDEAGIEIIQNGEEEAFL